MVTGRCKSQFWTIICCRVVQVRSPKDVERKLATLEGVHAHVISYDPKPSTISGLGITNP